MNRIAKFVAGTLLCVGLGTGMAAAEGGFDDGMSNTFHQSLKGKKVIFVPISIGMDIAAGFAAGMQRMANEEGFDFQIRDFSTYAVALHGKSSSTQAQQDWALGAIRKPVSDAQRFERVWERVKAYDGAYEMRP